MKLVDVLCIGHACWDLNFLVENQPGPDEKISAQALVSEGGGPAANAAYCISSLGGRAAFVGRLGVDAFGDAHLKELTMAGVDTTCVLRVDTATPIASVWVNNQGQRSVVNYSEPHKILDLDIGDTQPSCLLMDGHEWPASNKALLKFPNIPSVLDAGSFRESTQSLAKKVTHLIASTAFATSAAQSDKPEDWLKCLADNAPCVAVTRGEKGLVWKNENGGQGKMAAHKVKTVDTTGAGDIFHAAFALALARGNDFIKSLSWANKAAALSVIKQGGRSSCPCFSDIVPP